MTTLRERLRAATLNLLLLVVSLGGMALLLEGAVRGFDLFAEARAATRADATAEQGDGGEALAVGEANGAGDSGDPSVDPSEGAAADDEPADDEPSKPGSDSARRYGRYSERTRIHPFLGWSPKPRTHDHLGRPYAIPANVFGLRSRIHDYRELSAEDFVVGIFGGSVARSVATRGDTTLIRRLETLRPELAGRVVVANFSTSGYKQPQQLMLFQEMLLLGVPIDAVVTLDGFNELALGHESAKRGYHPLFPHRQFWQAAVSLGSGRMSEEQIELSAEVISLRRRADDLREGLATSWWGRSELLRAVYGVFVQRLEGRSVLTEKALREIPLRRGGDPFANLPDPCLEAEDGCLGRIVELWQRASAQMDALARAQGMVFVHALQPNQYVEGSKPLTPVELRRAYDPQLPWSRAAIAGYPLLLAAGEELRSQGVDFVDLTQMFRDNTDDLYRDRCCHFNDRGYRLIATRLAEEVAAALPETR